MVTERDPAEPLRVLEPSGALVPGAAPPLDDDDVLAALRLMKLSRAFDAKGASLQRQGTFGTFSQVGGQEASVVGSAWALDPARDWIVPQYRELPALLRHGYPLAHFIRYFQGNPAGGAIPAGVKMLPIQISIAAQLPHAAGLAWGLKLQHEDGVVLTYFGDGASSEGDFHEACNLAGLVGAPVVFFLQNNGWAISTPRRKQSAGRTLAERAPAYGFPGVRVDGNDLFAVYAATAQAVERARGGGGPTLIESVTRRIGPHNTADDPTRYADPVEDERWRALDPIERVTRYLVQRDGAHRARIAAFDADVADEIERALVEAAAGAPLGADQLFAHVYAEPPLRLARARAERAQPEPR